MWTYVTTNDIQENVQSFKITPRGNPKMVWKKHHLSKCKTFESDHRKGKPSYVSTKFDAFYFLIDYSLTLNICANFFPWNCPSITCPGRHQAPILHIFHYPQIKYVLHQILLIWYSSLSKIDSFLNVFLSQGLSYLALVVYNHIILLKCLIHFILFFFLFSFTLLLIFKV